MNRSVSLHRAHWIVFIAATVTGIFFFWASYAEIDEIAHARGQVIARSRTQVIQTANDGVIEEVSVQEGQQVKKGQILAKLERKQAEAAQNDSLGKVAALKAALVRLHAEVFNTPLVFPPDIQKYPQFVANQTELYSRRQSALKSELNALKESLRLVKEELALSQPLMYSGDIGKVEVIRLQKQAAELDGQINLRRNKYFQDAQSEI